MNKVPTLDLLRTRFQHLAEVGPEIVRAEGRHEGIPFGVFYFDFSEAVARPEFNLSAFVQDRVASDFYKHEGSLQWNYYLYFVLETATFRNLGRQRVTAIEADRTFARKYVRDSATLNRELASPLSATLHATEQTQDIASRWVKALDTAGLGGIADPRADYAPTIRHYLERSTPPTLTKVVAAIPEIGDEAQGQFVQRLDLGNYRVHPLQRVFDFGRVNLIRGVNGTGKTSLLEAIELCVCGANRRQGSAPPDAKLKIQFAGQDRAQVCPSATAKLYRDRDRSWYGGYYLQGNRLCQNFARFNFFDTDAAVQLSSDGSGKDIQAALDTLFLGEFANSIEERMRQSQERFKRELQAAQKELKAHRAIQRKTAEDLARIRAIKDTRETLTEELQAKASACQWKKAPARLTLPVVEALQEAAADEAESFLQATKRVRWMPRLTLSGMQREAEELRETVKELGKLRKASEGNAERLKDDQERLLTLQAELEILAKIARYHDEADAFRLAGNGEKTKNLRSTLDQLRETAALIRGLDFKTFEASSTPLKELIEAHTAEVTKQRRSLSRLKERGTALQSQFGKIKAVVDQIKGLGQHFCEVSPGAKSCPLCGTEHGDLRARLAALQLTPELQSPLGELTAQIAREERLLGEAQAGLETLLKLKQAEELLRTESKSTGHSVRALIAGLEKLPELIADHKTALDTALATEKRLRLAGLTETELTELLDIAVHERELPRTKLEKPDSLRNLQVEKAKALALIRATIKERTQLEKTNAAEIRRLHVLRLGESSVGDPDIEIERRQTTVDDVLSATRSAKHGIEIEDRADFAAVAARLDSFAKAVTRIHESLKRVEEKDALEQSLATTAAETGQAISKLESREARAKEALTALDEFLGSSYKEAYLRGVHAKLKDKLVTLFSRIHAPHEFSDVIFNGEMRLKRESGSLSPIREISTGQRAALALSIFLSMNSSVSAPWLLFDDPVAHVDDLNILSFLDNLRDLVFVGNRQVFFATANPRIADLFRRKFDCLGSEFKEFCFQR
jgi:exonuclease SbcC